MSYIRFRLKSEKTVVCETVTIKLIYKNIQIFITKRIEQVMMIITVDGTKKNQKTVDA